MLDNTPTGSSMPLQPFSHNQSGSCALCVCNKGLWSSRNWVQPQTKPIDSDGNEDDSDSNTNDDANDDKSCENISCSIIPRWLPLQRPFFHVTVIQY